MSCRQSTMINVLSLRCYVFCEATRWPLPAVLARVCTYVCVQVPIIVYRNRQCRSHVRIDKTEGEWHMPITGLPPD